MNPRAILFDVDDTLFDRKRAQREMAALLFQEFGDLFLGMDADAVLDAFLESDRISTQRYDWTGDVDAARIGRCELFLDLLGLDLDRAAEITATYVDRYPRVNAPIEGAKRVVGNLAKRYRLGVVSDGISDVQYRKIETLGTRHLFGCIVLSEEIGIRKPDPRIFWRASEALGVEPRECLYVGDSFEKDVVGAKEAGMWACWFNPEGTLPPRENAGADLEIRTLEELEVLLEVPPPTKTGPWRSGPGRPEKDDLRRSGRQR